MIHCDICHRPHHATNLPFLCAVDARNCLYESRVEYARALIGHEDAERRVEAALASSEGASKDQTPRSSAEVDRLRADEEASRDRTSQIIAQADRLRSEIDAARRKIAAKKDAIARKKSDLSSISAGTATRRNRQLEEVERSIQRLRYKWNRSADTMAATRAFLCEGSARLYGLRQVKKGSVKRYEIGGVEIFDLHAMNSMSPELISTCLAHIAHILTLACHYLAIRLPAEITLPHSDYPRPTIFALLASYKYEEAPFPGSLAPQIPPLSDNGEQKHVSRPRPLFIDKPLPTLAKEDPSAYSFFLEGVSLLAYDIAWACCSQGVSFGDKESYEDVCNMGQNLWRLLIGDQLHRRSVEPTFPSSLSPPTGSPRDDDRGEITNPKSTIGRWSHGTLHSFLGGAEGTEFVRNFKILSPLKLADRLKKRLSSEAPMLEWEKIEGDELEDGFDDGVLVRDHGNAGRGDLGATSVMTVRTVESNGGTPGVANTARGTSGWTRLKHR
ncbi:hypothetical protein N657DRAFT_561751 [Parathielavia appendiculata]|uniref:Autophagy-related protein 14 n=1 Tax=Parathielavia appendiculata TaxID=2587402 RepID=A0AAN6U806_9PEZI|nr:hypothetical protein N657DRAFT_561751 [Parathielavia appendiculata]